MTRRSPLIYAVIDGRRRILTEGAHVCGTGKIAGVFASSADARASDADSRALAVLGWEGLTEEQQRIAAINSERI